MQKWLSTAVCDHEEFGPQCRWKQHPHAKDPLYVSVGANTSDKEKLAWITQEIGPDGDLFEFAQKYVQLFPLTRMVYRSTVLQLFKVYNPDDSDAVLLEHQLHPSVLHDFQNISNPDILPLCHNCARPTKTQHQRSSLRSSRTWT